jgi:DNA-binding transcriptional ArsR family regulator
VRRVTTMGDLTPSARRTTPTDPRCHMLSSQGRAVLQALATAADGELPTADVLRRVHRPGASAAVTRASVSRTLRRLWAAGLVELAARDRKTLTAEAERLQRLSDAVHANPSRPTTCISSGSACTGSPIATGRQRDTQLHGAPRRSASRISACSTCT